MKHISSKEDWYYEFRPLIIQGIGAFGVISGFLMTQSGFSKLALACGVVLLGISHLIHRWRKTYRAKSFMR